MLATELNEPTGAYQKLEGLYGPLAVFTLRR